MTLRILKKKLCLSLLFLSNQMMPVKDSIHVVMVGHALTGVKVDTSVVVHLSSVANIVKNGN